MIWWDIVVSAIVSIGFALAFAFNVQSRPVAAVLTLWCSWVTTIVIVGYLSHGHWHILKTSFLPVLAAIFVYLFG